MPAKRTLVIGNSVYDNEDEFPSIDYAKKDAIDIFTLLTNSETSIFSSALSTCGMDLTRNEIDDTLGIFFKNVERNDLVLIYFAGHAKVIGGEMLHLAMKDSDPKYLARSAFHVESFLPYFKEKRINQYIVILDCCRSGVALNSPGIRHRGMINETTPKGFSGKGKIFIASAHEYQLAHELDDLEHGLFSNYFIQGIRSGNAVKPTEQYIGIMDLHQYVREQIEKEYPEISQEPSLSGTDVDGKLFVAKNPKYSGNKDESPFLRKKEALLLREWQEARSHSQAVLFGLDSFESALLGLKTGFHEQNILMLEEIWFSNCEGRVRRLREEIRNFKFIKHQFLEYLDFILEGDKYIARFIRLLVVNDDSSLRNLHLSFYELKSSLRDLLDIADLYIRELITEGLTYVE